MILIRKRSDGYVGVISMPHSAETNWVFSSPISEEFLRAKAKQLGVHPVDVADVVDEANANAFGYLPGPLSAQS